MQGNRSQKGPLFCGLPPIGSIGPASDIRPFLEPGVPQDLARTALRRAWIVDPAIRGFVGRLLAALDRPRTLAEVIDVLRQTVARTCRRNPRTKPGTAELLIDLSRLDFCLT